MKKFLTDPFSNSAAIAVAVVALVVTLLAHAAPAAPLAPLSLTGGTTNFSLLKVDDGTAAAPSLSFTGDTNTGIYRIGADDLGLTVGGTKIADVNAAGVAFTGNVTVTNLVSQSISFNASGPSAFLTTTVTGPMTVTGPLTVSGGISLTGGVGSFLVQTGVITSAMLNDISRSVELPILAWANCTTPLAISWTDGADAHMAFAKVNGSPVIAYDATGGSVDTDLSCTSFIVPPDFAGGAEFTLRVTQGGATVTNIESASCTVGIDGAAQGSAGTANFVNQTAVQTVSVVPAGAFAAGAAIGVNCKQGNASADDTVNFLSIDFQYTATE